jgi:sugar phosphate isomerase/epimerase
MRLISLAALTVLDLRPDEQIICAQECGYQGVGLRLIPATPQEKHYSLLGDKDRLKVVKNAISESGIQVLDIEIFRLKPETNVNDYEVFLEIGAEVNARNLLVAGNDPDRNRLSDNWEKLSALAKKYNIKPHMEPMPWTDVKDYLDAVDLVESGPEWGSVLIDPIHFFRAEGQCDQIKPEHTQRMGYCQLTDAPAEQPDSMEEILRQAREDRIPPGLGGLPLAQLISKLPADLALSIEIPLSPKWKCNSPKEKAQLALNQTIRFLQSAGQ